jgi:hypothetical protein
MRFEITYTEIHELLSNHFHLKISLNKIDEKKIKINYYVPFHLIFREIKEEKVFFDYEVLGVVNILAQWVRFFKRNKPGYAPVEWDSVNRLITIDLKKIKELSEFLKLFYLSNLVFADDHLLLVFKAKRIQRVSE